MCKPRSATVLVLGLIRLHNTDEGLDEHDIQLGLARSKEIIEYYRRNPSEDGAAIAVVIANKFLGQIALDEGCHKDAADCFSFTTCFVATRANTLPNPLRNEILSGWSCVNGNKCCSLNPYNLPIKQFVADDTIGGLKRVG